MENFKNEFVSLLKKFGIIKSSESTPEEMISYEVIYEADTKDSHGEWMSKETLEKACENFNLNLKKGDVVPNLFHTTETDTFEIVDTWIHKEFDVTVDGSGEPLKAGTWVAKIQYLDNNLWELKKMGVLGGVSIGGKGVLNEETGELTDISFDYTEETEE